MFQTTRAIVHMEHPSTAARTTAAGFLALFFAVGVGRFAFTPLLPLMQAEGTLDVESGGVLAGVHFIGYAISAVLAGWVTAFPRTTLLASLGAIGLATAVMGFTGSMAVWLCARWIAGVCSALVLVSASSYILRHLSDVKRDDLAGWVFAGVGGGIACVGLVALWLMIDGVPSQSGWLLLGAATGVAMVVVHGLMGPTPTAQPAPSEMRPLAAGRIERRIMLPYGAMGAGYIVPATYLPLMAEQAIASPFIFGWSWPLFGAAAALSTVMSTRLHQHCSNRQVWIASQIIMAFGLLLAALWGHFAAVVLGGMCVGAMFMVITLAGLKEAHRLAGAGSPQRHIAAMTAAFAFGQIVAPPAAGWAFTLTQSFSYPLVLASVALVISLVPMLGLSRPADAA